MPKLRTRRFRKKIQRISDQGVSALNGAHILAPPRLREYLKMEGRKNISDGRYEEELLNPV